MKGALGWCGAACVVLAVAMGLGGCATSVDHSARQAVDRTAYWSGRMALQLEGDFNTASQSFSATFELHGSALSGSLVLFNPLGSVVAKLQWDAVQALLVQGGNIKSSDSLTSLVQELTGSEIPVAALFDWLQGRSAMVDGWTADLSRMAEGRLSARRDTPLPVTSLRVVLDP